MGQVENMGQAASNYGTIDGGPLPIDLEYLSKNTANDPALTRAVLQIFCDQADTYLGALATAADVTAWQDAAHTLKGASRAVAAREVAQVAEDAEALIDLDTADRGAMLDQLEAAMVRATRYAEQLLEDSPFSG